MVDYRELCSRVQEVALEAGEFIALERKHFTSDKIEMKEAHNLVSYVDKGAEKIIVDRLHVLLPEAGFITEEDTATHNDEEFKWVIDPLDGTTNFVHGLPPYCVSIALMRGEEVVMGVVYEVTHREMFFAWEGSDAYLNGEQITVSDVRKLTNALIAVGFSYGVRNDIDNELSRMARLQLNTDGIRRLGSAAADLVYVACGRMDAFDHIKLSSWDVAAGAFIAHRAGAVVTDYKGGNNYVFGCEIVASNPHIYDEFMKMIAR